MTAAAIIPFGERGWLATLAETSEPTEAGIRAARIADQLRSVPGFSDSVGGIGSVAVRFDPAKLSADEARDQLETAINAEKQAPRRARQKIDIPVCYGGEHGPDLEATASLLGLDRERFIAMHAEQPYRVAMLGFAPGFTYLGTLDERLQAARRATPRPRVAPGSVAIAGEFTGIYPLPSPGGWRLIGQTPISLFNPHRDNPFSLFAGDEVCFKPISEDTFAQMAAS